MRNIDESLSSTSLLRYFQLSFFLAIFIIIIILTLRILYSRLDTAEKRERQSLSFTRETIIAQEQERGRIARELHDTVAQDLWRLSFQTDSIDKADDAAERSRLCAEVVREQKELIRRIRGICDNLIPPDFQRRGLADSLRSLCNNFRQRTGIECQLTIQKNLPLDSLDSDIQLQAFPIVQESLANIEKHAQAAEASVLVRSEEDNSLFVCVSDNGSGFSPPDRDSSRRLLAEGHFGLWSMYERAASLSGTLSVDSGEGEGTVLSLRIPLITQEAFFSHSKPSGGPPGPLRKRYKTAWHTPESIPKRQKCPKAGQNDSISLDLKICYAHIIHPLPKRNERFYSPGNNIG